MDAYPHDGRFASLQLFQRGPRWTTLQRGLQNRFTSRTPRELFDEWTMGFEGRSIVFEQLERELIEKLNDPNVRIYSQGFNLVQLLGSRAGGGHHIMTKRRLLLDYAIKGIYPLVPLITTTTEESFYLRGQSTDYPTALLDFDGNERAAIHLRNSDLNLLHILLQ
ncbi:MAG: hypothetical protein ABR577_20310, partial [Pyrinomonadaceae bacterium]